VRPASAASYARSHHDYPAADIFAACGTDVVAVTGGVVQEVTAEDRWRPGVDDPVLRGGLSVAVVGDDGVRYYGSHLRELDPATVPGSRVAAGQRLGAVGDSGNAAGTGCHLHFGLSRPCGPGDWERRRGEIWPQPYLDAWRDGAASSPAEEIAGRPAC
jgi:murein DD-endopeptidase MepM/ murein hydrolase activator NlpD